MTKLDPSKLAPSVAFVLVGAVLVIIGGTGVVPLGNPQPSLKEPLQILLCFLGILLILIGPIFVLIDLFNKNSKSQRDQNENVKKLAEGIASELRENTTWAAEALDRAQIKPIRQSVFSERMGHFYAEKGAIAEYFTPMLIDRCQLLAENDTQVFLLIDSGTTLYPIFERLAKDLASRKANGEEWIRNLRIVSNNLPGIETLMNEGRINPYDRYSPLAVECHLLPGEPLPIYSAVTGEETNEALQNLEKKMGDQARFIALTTGNWVRLRRSHPNCPVPLARGKGHFAFKQILINISHEVYVVAPLGKTFIDVSPEDVNNALGFHPRSKGQKQPYDEVQIGNEKAAVTRMVSTFRPQGFMLATHGTKLCTLLDVPQDEEYEILREKFRNEKEIHQIPHILFKFNRLPDDPWMQFKTEFPHKHTQHEKFIQRFFSVQSIPGI